MGMVVRGVAPWDGGVLSVVGQSQVVQGVARLAPMGWERTTVGGLSIPPVGWEGGHSGRRAEASRLFDARGQCVGPGHRAVG